MDCDGQHILPGGWRQFMAGGGLARQFHHVRQGVAVERGEPVAEAETALPARRGPVGDVGKQAFGEPQPLAAGQFNADFCDFGFEVDAIRSPKCLNPAARHAE